MHSPCCRTADPDNHDHESDSTYGSESLHVPRGVAHLACDLYALYDGDRVRALEVWPGPTALQWMMSRVMVLIAMEVMNDVISCLH